MPGEPVRLTRHGRNRLRLIRQSFGLTDQEVLNALDQPATISASIEGRCHAWRPFQDRWLRITYTRDAQGITIYTVSIRQDGPESEEAP